MRKFNATGPCVASKHYMVDTSNKLKRIKKLIDDGKYFTINRARQYGKTTTLNLLRYFLKDEYIYIRMSFEGVGDTMFESAQAFCQRFLWQIDKYIERNYAKEEEPWSDTFVTDFDLLGRHISDRTQNKKVVLVIDEIDKASDNKVFLHFLGMLREYYILRENEDVSTFQSVILAGVHDIKNIKRKMISDGKYIPSDEESRQLSPWNIAVAFKVDMSFDPKEISMMLCEYEEDHHTGMDISAISLEIYNYTSGYPFLVSRICQIIEEELDESWTLKGVQCAVKIILKEDNMLFDDLFKNLENNDELYNLVYDILIVGQQKVYSNDNPTIKFGTTFAILKEEDSHLAISNRIFEIRICNYFISKDEGRNTKKVTGILQHDVVKNGIFDMELCLRKFAEHYHELFVESDVEFLERHGRLLFLSYLRPLINGQGFYHIESGLTDLRRMDIIVDFGNQQFIIELKIWHGHVKHDDAYEQLSGYMKSKKAIEGYLLTFDFRKNSNKQPKEEWIDVGKGRIFDVVV